MIKIENYAIYGWEAAIRGMRNPMNSWDKMDSYFDATRICLGPNDYDLAMRLVDAGSSHRKYLRMIIVSFDLTAPLYFWKEFDTYKVGTVANSCSTMHKITEHAFSRDDFSCEHLDEFSLKVLDDIILRLNANCNEYLNWTKNDPTAASRKDYWWQLIQLLPSSYNQKRTISLNYEVLGNMYHLRKNHKLDEWREFCKWIESLPYSELITGKVDTTEKI